LRYCSVKYIGRKWRNQPFCLKKYFPETKFRETKAKLNKGKIFPVRLSANPVFYILIPLQECFSIVHIAGVVSLSNYAWLQCMHTTHSSGVISFAKLLRVQNYSWGN
jgi:hypothetical protein